MTQVSVQERASLWDESNIAKDERFSLKQFAGIMMDNTPAKAVAAYYRVRNREEQTTRYRDEICFACLCMNCLWDKGTAKRPLQEMLAEACSDPQDGKRIRSACIEVLDEPWRRDGYMLAKLCRLVVMLRKKSSAVMPDFERLAGDLFRWNSDSKYVQRNWIEVIFA